MCGGVRFELTASPEFASYCHCTRCQRRTGGSAAISARVARGSFAVTQGEERITYSRPDEGYEKVVATAPGHVDQVRRLVFEALTPQQIQSLDEICSAILGRICASDMKEC